MLLLLFSRNDGSVVIPPVEEPPASTGGGWLSREQVARLERIGRESNRARQRDWERAREDRAARLTELERIYDRVNGLASDEQSAELTAAVAPFEKPSDGAARAIDWQALYAQAKAVAQLTQALQRVIAEREREIAMRNEQDDLETLAFLADMT